MPKSKRPDAVIPEGWFSKDEASRAIRRNTKTVERIAKKGSVPTQYIANKGTRSITIYEREPFLAYFKEYTETPRPTPSSRPALTAPDMPNTAVALLRQAATARPALPAVDDPRRWWEIEEASAVSNLSVACWKELLKKRPELGMKDGRKWKIRPDALTKI